MDGRILGYSTPLRTNVSIGKGAAVKPSDAVWGVPFDKEKGYSGNAPVSSDDIVSTLRDDNAAFTSSLGASFSFNLSEISFTLFYTTVAVVAIILGSVYSPFFLYAGLCLLFLGFLGDAVLSRLLIGFAYGIASYELLPNRYFPATAVDRFNWYSQIVGVPSIFSIVGACFAAYFGWGVAAIWIIVSALFGYAIAATSNQIISYRHFDTSVTELSNRLGGIFAHSSGTIISVALSVFLFSTLAEILAAIFIASPSSVLVVLLVVALQLFVTFSIRYPFGFVVPLLSAAILGAIMLLTSDATSLASLTNSFTLTFLTCNDAAVIPATCAFGRRQFWVIIISVVVALLAQLKSTYSQIGRGASNAYILFVYVALAVIGYAINSNQANLTLVFIRATPDLSAIPFVFATVSLGTITGLLKTDSHESSTRYAVEPLHARFYGYSTIVVDSLYAIFALLIVASFSSTSLVFASWNSTVTGGLGLFVDSIAGIFNTSFSFSRQAGISLGYAIFVMNGFNTMESLTRTFYRSLVSVGNKDSYRISSVHAKAYPDSVEYLSYWWNPTASFLLAASVVILSFSGQLKDLWIMAGLYSMAYVAYLVIMGGFYCNLVTNRSSRVFVFALLGAGLTGLQLYASISFILSLVSASGLNLLGENPLWWLLTLNAGICIAVGAFLVVLLFQLIFFPSNSKSKQFVRGNRTLRRVGFFMFPHDSALI